MVDELLRRSVLEDKRIMRVAELCRRFGGKDFPLSCRELATVHGLEHSEAATFLKILVESGFLAVTDPGKGNMPRRYRYIG